MAKMGKAQVEAIVAKELPGYRVQQVSAAVDSTIPRVPAEETTPEVDQLMKKFGLEEEAQEPLRDAATRNSARDVSNGDSVDDEIAVVERTDTADPWSRGNRPKAKVISSNGKIIGSQG